MNLYPASGPLAAGQSGGVTTGRIVSPDARSAVMTDPSDSSARPGHQ
ncbi:hypothetical protein [Haloarchaeobius sp. TZWWS8]